MGAATASFDCLAAERDVIDAYKRREWRRLRALMHEKSLFISVAGGQTVLGPDDTVESIRRAVRGGQTIEFGEPEAVDENAVVVVGTVHRVFPDARGSGSSRRGWIATFHEGQLFRWHVCASRGEAIREYHAHGISLGFYSVAKH